MLFRTFVSFQESPDFQPIFPNAQKFQVVSESQNKPCFRRLEPSFDLITQFLPFRGIASLNGRVNSFLERKQRNRL